MSADDAEKADRKLTDGARELRAYLDAKKLSITSFCEQNDLDRIQVQRVLNGDRWKRIAVDFADAIARATNGEVPVTSWKSATATKESPSGTRLPDDADKSDGHPAVRGTDAAPDTTQCLPPATSSARAAGS